MTTSRKSGKFYVAIALVLAIIIVSIGNYLRWWDLHFYLGPEYLHHWLSFIGAGYIAIFTPIYSIMKRRSPKHFGTLLNIHVFGNLVAFLLVSIHFTQQMGRPAQFAPTLGTGLTLYIIVAIMVITGFVQRFQLAGSFLRSWRFVHVGLSLSFYIVVVIHILHNLGFI
ncbi:MAG: hypothetical protein A2Z77_02440 [Chloroflexi bacterium RBG_13_51_36]|nr:MAG: hypothetical protein A2Z77_02440 [Chloroflexi bacterium RBG_13_51_36]